ncbi:hypothetical protein ACLOJK_021556 [Asimina triloba]
MDPEQTFLRVHAKLSGMLLRVLKPRIRTALEYLHLFVALALFCLLVVMHTNFVQQWCPWFLLHDCVPMNPSGVNGAFFPGCSSEFSGFDLADAELVHIKITSSGLWSRYSADDDTVNTLGQDVSTDVLKDMDGDGMTVSAVKFWSNWIVSGVKRGKPIFKYWKNDKEYLELQGEIAVEQGGSEKVLDGSEVVVDSDAQQINFPLSSKESVRAAVLHFFSKFHMLFSSFWRCMMQFSVQWLEKRSKDFEPTYLYTVEKGYFFLPDGAKSHHNIRTVNISISAQHSCFGNSSVLDAGYLFNFQTKEFLDLSHAHEPAGGSMRFEVQLQHHARYQLPTFQLIFVHVIESLVFVPVCLLTLFEVPALERYMRSRQLGVHITSSTILASTLHITRVNMRNSNPANNELGSDPWPREVPGQTRPASDNALQEPLATEHQDLLGNPLQFQGSDRRPTEAAANTPLNSFNSLLLWILGGASSDNRGHEGSSSSLRRISPAKPSDGTEFLVEESLVDDKNQQKVEIAE